MRWEERGCQPPVFKSKYGKIVPWPQRAPEVIAQPANLTERYRDGCANQGYHAARGARNVVHLLRRRIPEVHHLRRRSCEVPA